MVDPGTMAAAASQGGGGGIGGAIGNIAGNVLGGKGARKAAKRQEQAAREARQMFQSGRGEIMDLLSPYSGAGAKAINPLLGALGVPGYEDNYENPLLAKTQALAMRDARQAMAATGRRGNTGAMMQSLMEASLNPAFQMQQARISGLQNLMGLGAQTGVAQGGLMGTYDQMIGDTILRRGEAQAARSAAPYMAASNIFNQQQGFNAAAGQGQSANPFAALFGG